MDLQSLRNLWRELDFCQQRGLFGDPSHDGSRSSETRVVRWPGCGEFSLTIAQRRVVRILADSALWGNSAEVEEDVLVAAARAAGSLATTLEEVFGQSPAWGKLVILTGKGASLPPLE